MSSCHCEQRSNLLATCHCEGAVLRRLWQSPSKRITLLDKGFPFNGRLLRQKAARSDIGYLKYSSNKSFHSAFIVFINSIFLSRGPALICFSRAMAAFTSSPYSKYTNLVRLYFFVNAPPLPSLCSKTLRCKSFVTPVYKTVL